MINKISGVNLIIQEILLIVIENSYFVNTQFLIAKFRLQLLRYSCFPVHQYNQVVYPQTWTNYTFRKG